MTTTTRSAEDLLPVPRDLLLEVGLTDGQVDEALERPPQVRGWSIPDDAEFDVDEVARVLRAIRALRHTKTRRWGGKPLNPDPWQVVWIIAPVFGWYRPDGTRVVRELYVEIPRKNGKTTLSTALVLLLLAADGEPGAEVYSAAVDRTQASRIVDDAKRMCLGSPLLRRHVKVQSALIKHPRSDSIFRALSKISEAAHGLNVHGAVIDELHVHKSRDLVDAIVTGVGSRDQPLVIVITTADEGDEHTIYDEWHTRAENQHAKATTNPALYAVVWRGDRDRDPFDLEHIQDANPGYGTSLNPDVVADEIEKARTTPSYLPTYLRLRLNIRESSTATLLRPGDWSHADCIQMHPDLAGRMCYGGFDLSSTTDFTAAALLFPPDDPTGMFDVLARIWIPQDRVEQLEHQCQVPLRQWIRDGWLHTTEGDVVDYRPVREWLQAAAGDHWLIWTGYDRWNATETVNEMIESGLDLEPIGQGYASLSAPTKLLDKLVRRHQIRHAGHPVLRWMAVNLAVRRDENDNVKPVKPERDKSSRRIDGMSAVINALFGYQRNQASPPTIHAWPDEGEAS